MSTTVLAHLDSLTEPAPDLNLVLSNGTDTAKLKLVGTLVEAEIKRLQTLRGRIRDSVKLMEKLRTRIATTVLNAAAPFTIDALNALVAEKVGEAFNRPKDKGRVETRLAPEDDIDCAGPYNLLSPSRRHPNDRRTIRYNLNPDTLFHLKPETRKRQASLDFLTAPELHELENLTISNLTDEYFFDAKEKGLCVVVKRDCGLGAASRQILETAVHMAQELASGPKPKRKSRANLPAFPKWAMVARRLDMEPRAVQKAVQRLRVYPIDKLFELVKATAA